SCRCTCNSNAVTLSDDALLSTRRVCARSRGRHAVSMLAQRSAIREARGVAEHAMPIKRGFVDIPGGQIHYRELREQPGRVVVMLHSNPGSSAMLLPMIERFGKFRPVIAPDTPGFGDSTPAPQARPEIADYAAATIAALDALGIERFDLYGNHTGANMAV